MPRLEKGGKWIFGWVVVSADKRIHIPEEAMAWYEMCPEPAMLIQGSIRSGGMAVCPLRLWPSAFGDKPLACPRTIAETEIEADGTVSRAACDDISPGDVLLAVYGSGLALGLLTRGPIYQLALEHQLPVHTLDIAQP